MIHVQIRARAIWIILLNPIKWMRYVVDKQFVAKVGMTFKRLEEAGKFCKDYSKLADFSTKIRNTTWKGDEIKTGINCPAKIYVHILKDIGLWIISKVILNYSHPCYLDQAEMLKQHRKLSMFVHRTIENTGEAEIRPSKMYQSFIVAVGGHRELSFIEKDMRNYITREVRNVFE
ncbi:hypothetical protein Ahy_B03g066057 isoform B [Arachis hypogaea]|uniref:Protein FAR1-RELATED SEQUENCE n=1 Tax=Arachis hypogaea TaxID=3818 RepID=A0A445A320_ARAHY|nr:hypothetical protein Ahy_B03g066057 isoform B [Arachis hypogaea]